MKNRKQIVKDMVNCCDCGQGFECIYCLNSWSDQILKDVVDSGIKVHLDDWTPSVMESRQKKK